MRSFRYAIRRWYQISWVRWRSYVRNNPARSSGPMVRYLCCFGCRSPSFYSGSLIRIVLILGFSAFAAANLLGMQLTHDWAEGDFIIIVLLQSFGQAFTLLPIIIIAISNIDRRRVTAFIAYIQSMRLAGAEIGVALMATWLRVREQVHSNFI